MAARKAPRQPMKYQESFVTLAYWMAHAGLTEEEMAEQFGVYRKTLYRWKDKYPDFADAIERGKVTPDDKVEASLYKRAIGYEVTEIRDKDTWRGTEHEEIVKHLAPDVTACIFWLKNRRGDKWRDKQEIDARVEGTVNIIIPAEIKDV